MLLNDKNIIDSLPDWVHKIKNEDDYYLVLGDDMDSFLSCLYLNRKFGLRVGGFYDFSKGLYLSEKLNDWDKLWRQPIYVDICMADGKCFDNHYSFLMYKDPDMVSFNHGIPLSQYFNKYNGGVFAMLVSLYENDLSKRDEEFFLNMLCIDGFYRGIYNKGGAYAHVNYSWFEKMGMLNEMKAVTDKYDADFFQNRIDDLKINRKFSVNADGYIESTKRHTKELPEEKFELVMPVKQDRANDYTMLKAYESKKIISAARVYNNTYQYSYAV